MEQLREMRGAAAMRYVLAQREAADLRPLESVGQRARVGRAQGDERDCAGKCGAVSSVAGEVALHRIVRDASPAIGRAQAEAEAEAIQRVGVGRVQAQLERRPEAEAHAGTDE